MESVATFSFSRALHLMKYNSSKVRRLSWSDKDEYIRINEFNSIICKIDGEEREPVLCKPYFSGEEILANDWVEVY